MAQGDYAKAEPLYRQAVGIIRANLEATATIQSERQQLAMLQSVREYLDHYLELTVISGRCTEAAYRETLTWKGEVLHRDRQIRTAADTPELLALFGQLQRVATQLSKLAWATPDSKEEANWRGQVDKLSVEKERLETELSSLSAAYRQAKHQVSLEELQAALPKNAILVDLLEYNHRTPSNKTAAPKTSWERRLIAFVVSHDRPVAQINLGPMQSLSEAIDTWRQTFGMSPQGAAAGRLLAKESGSQSRANSRGLRLC